MTIMGERLNRNEQSCCGADLENVLCTSVDTAEMLQTERTSACRITRRQMESHGQVLSAVSVFHIEIHAWLPKSIEQVWKTPTAQTMAEISF